MPGRHGEWLGVWRSCSENAWRGDRRSGPARRPSSTLKFLRVFPGNTWRHTWRVKSGATWGESNMAGKFLRGAFVEFMETFLIPAPNVVLFQFNPESISHSWTPAQTSAGDDDNPLAISGPPSESFDF